MDHEGRMELARRVTDFVLRRHPEVIAVAVHGSTAHGEDREWSDLEMFAVTRGKADVRGYGTIHDGIVVECGLASEEDARRDAGDVSGSWPISVDGWIHTLSMHDPEGVLPQLAALAGRPDPQKFDREARGALVAMYEDLCKMRNHAASGEDAMVRFMAPGFAIWGLARFLAFLNRGHYNGTRDLLTRPRTFERVPPHLWEDYPALLAADGDAATLLERAERSYAECRDLLQAAGVALPERPSLEEALELGRFPRA